MTFKGTRVFELKLDFGCVGDKDCLVAAEIGRDPLFEYPEVKVFSVMAYSEPQRDFVEVLHLFEGPKYVRQLEREIMEIVETEEPREREYSNDIFN